MNGSEKYTLRPYQQKVLDVASKVNTIAFLPTGAGKTLIAVQLIRDRLQRVRDKVRRGYRRKLIVFLAPTKILVGQQKKYIESNIDAVVIEFTGDTSIVEGQSSSNWNKSAWENIFVKSEVIVMTPEILKQMLHRRFFIPCDFDTMIIDECHHAFGSNPLVTICKIVSESPLRPLILAMTASPIACKSGSVSSKIAELEANLSCQLVCSEEILTDFKKLVPIPNYSLFRYTSDIPDSVAQSSISSDVFATAVTIRQKTAELFPRGCVDLLKSDGKSFLLLHALLRVRHANHINEIYKLLRTVQMQPNDFEEFRLLDLPNHDVLSALRQIAATDTATTPSSPKSTTNKAVLKYMRLRTKHLLLPAASVYNGLAEWVLDMGKLIRIVEECGILCAIHAFQICLSNRRSTEDAKCDAAINLVVGDTGPATAPGQDNAVVDIGRAGPCKQAKMRVSNERVSSVDMDRAGCIAEELQYGPFRAVDLLDLGYCACVSMLDMFVCLITSLGSDICAQAGDTLLSSFSTKEAPPCFQLVAALLQKVASAKGSLSFLSMKLTIEGVLVLVPEFCSQYGPQTSSIGGMKDSVFRLCEQDLRVALSSACQAIIRCVPHSLLLQLFKVQSPDRDYLFEPLQPFDSLVFAGTIGQRVDDRGVMMQMHQQLGTVFGIAGGYMYKDYMLATNKVVALYHVWSMIETSLQSQHVGNVTATSDQTSDWAGIVFCRMRLTALSVSNLMSTIYACPAVETPQPTANCMPLDFTSQEVALSLHGLDDTVGSVEHNDSLDFIPSSMTGTNSHRQLVVTADVTNSVSATSPTIAVPMTHSVPVSKANFRPLQIIGNTNQRIQLEALTKFKSGDFNILFATDVVEEGLDVRACQVVINFDLPTTVKSYIQRRGRARAANSTIIALVPHGYCGTAMISDLMSFNEQEKEMECYAERNLASMSHDKSTGGELQSDAVDEEKLIALDEVLETMTKTRERIVETPQLNTLLEESVNVEHATTGSCCMLLDRSDVGFEAGLGNNLCPTLSVGERLLYGQFVVRGSSQYKLGTATVKPGPIAMPLGNAPFAEILPPPPRPPPPSIPMISDSYRVESTDVIADTSSSTQMLARFCQALPHDSFYQPKPIYWVSTIRHSVVAEDAPSFSRNSTYRCSVLLPPSVPQRCRFIIGPVCDSKTLAKSMASLCAIRQLHQHGELNDLLMTNGSKQSDKAEKTAQQHANDEKDVGTSEGSLVVSSPATRSSGKKRSVADSLYDTADEDLLRQIDNARVPAKCDTDLVTTVVKTVPEGLTVPPTLHAIAASPTEHPAVGLYLYAVRAQFVDDLSRDIILNCKSCSNNFFAINEVGLAFTTKLPQDVFESVFDCNFRETEGLKIKIEFLDYRKVSNEELIQMQRFHRSVLCWESESKRYLRPEFKEVFDELSRAGLPDEEWLPHNADLRDYYDGTPQDLARVREGRASEAIQQPVSHDEWRRSANGAWYLIFPLPDNIFEETNTSPGTAFQDVKLDRSSDALFFDCERWCSFLKQSADEAQILVHNLRMQQRMNAQEYTDFYQPFLPVQEVSSLSGLLVTRGPGGIFWVMDRACCDG